MARPGLDTARKCPVVDLNFCASLPEMAGAARPPVERQSPARSPGRHRTATSPDRRQGSSISTGLLPAFGMSPNSTLSLYSQPAHALLHTPPIKGMQQWMQMPRTAAVMQSGLHGSTGRKDCGRSGDMAVDHHGNGWADESYSTRVLRAPQDKREQPCNIEAMQISWRRIVTLSPECVRIWELLLEDNSSSGLLYCIPPVSISLACLSRLLHSHGTVSATTLHFHRSCNTILNVKRWMLGCNFCAGPTHQPKSCVIWVGDLDKRLAGILAF